MHAISMADLLVANSKDSYIEKAVALANDEEQLQNIRKDLRQQMKDSPLCDAASFAKKVEDAYLNMWERYTGINVKENESIFPGYTFLCLGTNPSSARYL